MITKNNKFEIGDVVYYSGLSGILMQATVIAIAFHYPKTKEMIFVPHSYILSHDAIWIKEYKLKSTPEELFE